MRRADERLDRSGFGRVLFLLLLLGPVDELLALLLAHAPPPSQFTGGL